MKLNELKQEAKPSREMKPVKSIIWQGRDTFIVEDDEGLVRYMKFSGGRLVPVEEDF